MKTIFSVQILHLIKEHGLIVISLFALGLSQPSCITGEAGTGAIEGYRMDAPDARIILPGILNEVSGITVTDTNSIACVQDEIGTIFIYDIRKQQIRRRINFEVSGDFEGITYTGKSFFVLRSDGTLFQVEDTSRDQAVAEEYNLILPSGNNEGLCFDAKSNRVLISPKSNSSKGSGSKDSKSIYAFNLNSMALDNKPVFEININDLQRSLLQEKADLPIKKKKKSGKYELHLKFEPSCIDIHPVTGDVYIISAADNMLFVFTPCGVFFDSVKLPPILFSQPEGLAFFENGDMLVSNEGKGGNPTLLRFNYRP